MDTIFKGFLYTHILGGGIGLTLGILVMVLKKGDQRHRRIGKWFYYAMNVSAVAALVLACLHPNTFLFIVGIFTLYMVLSGDRILKLKRLDAQQQPILFDWIITYTMLLFGLGFILMGGYMLTQSNFGGLIPMVFGGIGLLMVRADFSYFRGKIQDKNYWIKTHISKMMGANIAACTAFLVVNNTILPDLVVWLAPTAIGTVLIIMWRKPYR